MFDHKTIDKKWQEFWNSNDTYATPTDPKNKRYVLDMFPYPSGAGLHVGHPEGYTATDILSRYFRMKGFDVLHPMGWDAFGLPAENYAIKMGVHPNDTTQANINHFREQIKKIGLSYDWSREIDTSQPEYYKWTQWIFLQLFKKGLAYKKEAYVNWCPKDQTVLANEQVVNGNCERCGSQVEQKLLSQWFFKITAYAERLLRDIEQVDWPASIKQMQKNWIGRSEGALIKFFTTTNDQIEVFTTRPDTLFGATYIVLAPEHPLVEKITTAQQRDKISSYIESTKLKSELERTSLDKNKTGEFTGAFAINPATDQEIPIWIADYVLVNYGTGAVMAVPAHDERDFEFAKKFALPIKKVISGPKIDPEPELYTDEGTMIGSGEYNGLDSQEARSHIAADFGRTTVQYKLRDWLVSRQRYWGAPIPIVYCDDCGMQPVNESDLPIKLPTDVDFKPTGESPLVHSKEFHNAVCPKCGKVARRDSDTMDTFVDSSWYFLRFADPHNDNEFASPAAVKKWLAVDAYQGGAEHAVLHLLYARFFTKALIDLGHLPKEAFPNQEPFLKLRNQGLIMGPDGEKMSKSKGNVINPDEVVAAYGADAFRMYEMFMGPLEDAKPWNTQGIVGLSRFLDKVIRASESFQEEGGPNIHKLIKKITADIEDYKFNTAIAAFMEFLNENKALSQADFETFLKLLAPFAPHITEELWQRLGHTDSIHKQDWPQFDESLTKNTEVSLVVQIMGRTRGTLNVPVGQTQAEIKEKVLANEAFKKYLDGQEIVKEFFVPDKLINFVTK